jgi:uncharacterized RDD family membrane protein YckC
MTAQERYVQEVISALPRDERLRRQIEMEVRSHIAERMEHGETAEAAMSQLGDPVQLAESYLSAVPLVSASFLSRAGAKILDLVIYLLAVAPVALMAWFAFEVGGDVLVPLLPRILLVICLILIVPGFCLYTAIAEHRFSTTVGKSLVGLRVVRESGGRIGFGQALVRQLPLFLEVFWIDVLFALFTDKSQRAFEMVSKTRVVRADVARFPVAIVPRAIAV